MLEPAIVVAMLLHEMSHISSRLPPKKLDRHTYTYRNYKLGRGIGVIPVRVVIKETFKLKKILMRRGKKDRNER